MHITRLITLLSLAFALPLSAQDAPAPAETPTPPWDATSNPADDWTLADQTLRDALNSLLGSYKSSGTAEMPALVVHFAPMNVEGLDNAVYYELHRADDRPNPFRSGVIHAYLRQGEPRLRYMNFAKPETTEALATLWAAPYALPTPKADDLVPIADLKFTAQRRGFEASTLIAYPTSRDGATEFSSHIRLRGDTLELHDRGFDPAGNRIWGSADPVFFERTTDVVDVQNTDTGLIIIDLHSPDDAKSLAEGGDVAVHYSGYLTDGTRFDSSRGRRPFRITVPGRVIDGWNQGLAGMREGGRRRLVIPPYLGYGPRGAGGVIPPDATLIFDVECLWLQNPGDEPATTEGPEPASDQGGE